MNKNAVDIITQDIYTINTQLSGKITPQTFDLSSCRFHTIPSLLIHNAFPTSMYIFLIHKIQIFYLQASVDVDYSFECNSWQSIFLIHITILINPSKYYPALRSNLALYNISFTPTFKLLATVLHIYTIRRSLWYCNNYQHLYCICGALFK